jgi:hypothetical protein
VETDKRWTKVLQALVLIVVILVASVFVGGIVNTIASIIDANGERVCSEKADAMGLAYKYTPSIGCMVYTDMGHYIPIGQYIVVRDLTGQ